MRVTKSVKWVLVWLSLLGSLAISAQAQPTSPQQMGREIDYVLQEFQSKGTRPFQRSWPGGSVRESLQKEADGTINYTEFHATGGYSVRYQRKPGKVIKLERYFSNGNTALLIIQDERILDYTSYWENGVKKAKYQRNRQTSRVFYDARDEKGRQVYPIPR